MWQVKNTNKRKVGLMLNTIVIFTAESWNVMERECNSMQAEEFRFLEVINEKLESEWLIIVRLRLCVCKNYRIWEILTEWNFWWLLERVQDRLGLRWKNFVKREFDKIGDPCNILVQNIYWRMGIQKNLEHLVNAQT